MIVNSASSLSFDFINNSVATAVRSKESELTNQISAMGKNPTTGDLLALQQQVQQWTMMTQVQSTIVKELSDAMKGVIQKAG